MNRIFNFFPLLLLQPIVTAQDVQQNTETKFKRTIMYSYSLLILCTEFQSAHTQTKFCLQKLFTFSRREAQSEGGEGGVTQTLQSSGYYSNVLRSHTVWASSCTAHSVKNLQILRKHCIKSVLQKTLQSSGYYSNVLRSQTVWASCTAHSVKNLQIL